jgi:HEAT repeat protein
MKIWRAISTLSAFSLFCSSVCLGAAKSSQDDAIGIVLETLRSGDQQMQAAAIAMVKEMPGTDVTKALAKELPHLSAISQVQLLSALGDRGDAAALPAVVTAAKAKDQSVRIAALRALGRLGDASSVELLAQAAAGSSGDEQKAARASLYRLRDPKVDQVILADIPKADAKTKFELVRSVGERDIRAAVSVLLKTAGDEDDKVRIESLRVLKIIAGPADLPSLVELLIHARSSFDRSEAQKTVVAVAHKIEDKNHQGGSILAVLPAVKDLQAKCSLLSVLGKIGDNNGLPVLTAALKDENDEVQTAAIRALADWPTSKPVADLMNVAESSGNKVHKILALRGVVRLLGLDSARPAEETVAMYAKAMSLSPDVAEKKRVLSGLAGTKSLAALQMAATYLDDETLSSEAGFAAVKIARNIEGDFPEQTMSVLKKIVQTAKSDSLRRQAAEVISNIEHPQQKANVQGQEVK